MKLWSRGLGKQELWMDFMRYGITSDRADGCALVSGKIMEPVIWDFTIRFYDEDVPGLIRLATRPSVLGLIMRHYLRKVMFWRKVRGPVGAERLKMVTVPGTGSVAPK
jgi:hypothetical protein